MSAAKLVIGHHGAQLQVLVEFIQDEASWDDGAFADEDTNTALVDGDVLTNVIDRESLIQIATRKQ